MADSDLIVSSIRVYDGKIVRVDRDTIRAPDGSELELEMIRHNGASAVVALTDPPESNDPGVLLIHQFRYAAGGRIWEIPAGVLEPGETPETCARRELAEETGATAGEFRHLTTIYTTPGFTDEKIHLFLASGISAGEPRHERDEFLTIETRRMSEIMAMIRDGEIIDGKSIVALLYVAGFVLGY